MNELTRYDYVIIGCGLAGISAAAALINSNKKVLLIEARQIPGGRFYSINDKNIGEMVDNGQHMMMGAYKSTIDLFHSAGIVKHLYIEKSINIPFFGANGDAFRLKPIFPGKIGMVGSLLRLPGVSLDDIIGILRLFPALKKEDNLNCRQWLEKYNQTDNIYKYFWEPLILATLNTEPENAASGLLKTVMSKAFFGSSKDTALIYPRRPFDFFNRRLVQYLKNSGIHVSFGERVLSIENESNIKIITNKREFSAVKVISAIPPDRLSKILTEEQQKQTGLENIGEFSYSTIISVYLWYDKEFFSGKMAGLLSSKLQWIFNRGRIQGNISHRYPGRYAVTISSADGLKDKSNEEIIDFTHYELSKIFPQSNEARLLYSRIFIDPRATIRITPEANRARPHNRTKAEWLCLSGDWIQTGLPATIESAVQSGFYALK